MNSTRAGRLALFSGLVLLSLSAVELIASDRSANASPGGSWLRKVPDADRARVNPFAADPQAIAAGNLLFHRNCAQCHGADVEGRHGRPSLRSERVAHATDGELAWLLRNGSLAKGMPTWSTIPEPERWQIIAFLRSLPRGESTAAVASHP